ncbi:hypothetical protein HBI47_178710 [Parastagonospora nodorum]|nr:hypothetical protein HBI47_178710 [Parastagonospora nodorum]
MRWATCYSTRSNPAIPSEPEMLDCVFAGLVDEDAPAVHVLDPDLENDGIGFGSMVMLFADVECPKDTPAKTA